MKVENLRAVAKEYRRIADERLDHRDICRGFSEKCQADGIDWTQLRKLVDAQAADARDGKDRVSVIVEKADFAASYADLLTGKDERKRETRSSENPPQPTQTPVQAPPIEPPSRTVLREQLTASIAAAEIPDIPPFLDRRAGA